MRRPFFVMPRLQSFFFDVALELVLELPRPLVDVPPADPLDVPLPDALCEPDPMAPPLADPREL